MGGTGSTVAWTAALTPEPVSVQSLDSCMELDSLRERVQRIHMETEGREETRLLQQDQEEGEGQGAEFVGQTWVCSPMSILLFSVMYGSKRAEDDLGCWCWGKKAVVEAQQGPAFNRAAEHRSDLSAGLSPLTDTDGEVTGATNLACYMQDPDFGYQDFARRDEDQTQVFRVQVRFLLSQRAAVRAATSPLLSSPVLSCPLLVGSGWLQGCPCSPHLVQLLL